MSNITKLKEAIRYALIHYENPNGRKGRQVKRGDALKVIAHSLIDIAINGGKDSLPAIKELADRLDGKPSQAIVGVEGEPITVVQRVIVSHVLQDDTLATLDAPPSPKLIN